MKLLRIKWENITTILITIYLIYGNTIAFIEAGFDFNIFLLELIADIMILYGWHYCFKILRKSLLEL